MPLHRDMVERSRAVRPQILKLARRGCLVDECFKEFQRLVYPGAPPDQVAAMRTCFFAGAQELLVMMQFGADTEVDDVTREDLEFMTHVADEMERFHRRTIDAAGADPGPDRGSSH